MGDLVGYGLLYKSPMVIFVNRKKAGMTAMFAGWLQKIAERKMFEGRIFFGVIRNAYKKGE